MKNGSMRYALLGISAGLVLGFILANGYSRAEMEKQKLIVRQQQEQKSSSSPQTPAGVEQTAQETLSPEELRQVIARADANAKDLSLQRSIGLALYRYAALEQDSAILGEAVRLLERAQAGVSSSDTELLSSLGNAHFILARQGKPEQMAKARAVYQKALQADAKNADLRVDLGLTYLFAQPSEPLVAIKEFSQVLKSNSSFERGLEGLVVAQMEAKLTKDAAATLEKLKQVNPNNPSLPNLEIQLAQQELSPNPAQ